MKGGSRVLIDSGLYRHFEGDLYWVALTAVGDATPGARLKRMVVYQSQATKLWYVCSAAEFVGSVTDALGQSVPRFSKC